MNEDYNNKVVVNDTVSIDKKEDDNGFYPGSRNSNLLKIFIFILIILGAAAYIIINKIQKDKESDSVCTKVLEYTEYECGENKCTITLDEKKYTIDADYSDTLIHAFDYTDYLEIKVCTKKDSIYSYKLINKNTEENIEAVSHANLREKLGLKVAGEYSETATLVKIDKDPGVGVETDKYDNQISYTYYYVTLKFSNNEVEELMYKIYDNSNVNFNPNNYITDTKYNVKYEVEEDEFGDFYFYLLDIK